MAVNCVSHFCGDIPEKSGLSKALSYLLISLLFDLNVVKTLECTYIVVLENCVAATAWLGCD